MLLGMTSNEAAMHRYYMGPFAALRMTRMGMYVGVVTGVTVISETGA